MITKKEQQHTMIRVSERTHEWLSRLCPKSKSYGTFVDDLLVRVYGTYQHNGEEDETNGYNTNIIKIEGGTHQR